MKKSSIRLLEMKHILYHQFMGLVCVASFRNYQVNKKELIQGYSCELNLKLLLILNQFLLILLIQVLQSFRWIKFENKLDLKRSVRMSTGSKKKIFDIQTNDLSIKNHNEFDKSIFIIFIFYSDKFFHSIFKL